MSVTQTLSGVATSNCRSRVLSTATEGLPRRLSHARTALIRISRSIR